MSVMGYKLWIKEGRLYPVVPLFDFLGIVPPLLHTVLFALILIGLLLLMIFPQKRFLLIGTLIIILCSCVLDILRWQPWEYQFIFFLLIFIFNHKKPQSLYSAIVFVLASLYIYSGLHKVNGGFLHMVWDTLILNRFLGLPGALIKKLHYAGLIVPLIEVVAGLSLLFVKKKLVPVIVLTVMHVFIIILLCKVDINYNSIVLPWNFAILMMLWFYYYQEPYQFLFTDIIKQKNIVVLSLWGIAPVLSFIGYWDVYLSSSLYSGDTKYMDICIENTAVVTPLRVYFSNDDRRNICTGQVRLPLYRWARDETGILPYPEDWYYKKFAKEFKKMYPDTDATLTIYSYPFKERRQID